MVMRTLTFLSWILLALYLLPAPMCGVETTTQAKSTTTRLSCNLSYLLRGGCAFVLPADTPYQKFQDLAGENLRLGSRRHMAGGNQGIMVAETGTKTPKVSFTLTIQPWDWRAAVRPAAPLPSDAAVFLRATKEIDSNSRELKMIAAALRSDSPVETVERTLAWLQKNLKYKWPVSTTRTASEVARSGVGCCGCYAKLFVALVRCNGIPARAIRVLVKATVPDALSCHSQVEVALAGAGWVPLEPQAPQSLGVIKPDWFRWFHYQDVGNWEELFSAEHACEQEPKWGTGMVRVVR